MRRILRLFWLSRPFMMLRRLRQRFFPRPEDIGIGKDHPLRFASECRGLIHVGAHEGEEAWIYDALKIPQVLWVEGDPDLMSQLRKTISGFKRQTAVEALLAETAGELVTFYVTNNDGASSSVLPLGRHAEMYPEVEVAVQKNLVTETLEKILEIHDPSAVIDGMVIDVQGAELSVLKGAGDRLLQFKWIFAECSDFELYKGCCTLETLTHFLGTKGFLQRKKYVHKEKLGVGTIWDVLFEAC